MLLEIRFTGILVSVTVKQPLENVFMDQIVSFFEGWFLEEVRFSVFNKEENKPKGTEPYYRAVENTSVELLAFAPKKEMSEMEDRYIKLLLHYVSKRITKHFAANSLDKG